MDYETNRIITQEELNKMGEELGNYAESLINQQFKKISNDMHTYEKKYKEANDKVVARFGTNVAKEIFADLYESEDENVRKWLLNLVQSLPDKGLIFSSYDDIEKEKVLAWLEKQDPKKHEEELEKAYKTADEVQYKRGYEDAVKDTEKQGEQKPAWSEEDKEMLGRIRSIVEKYAFSQSAVDVNGDLCEKEYIEADNWLKSLKDKYTWKPSIAQLNALSIVSKGNAPDDIEAIVSLYNDLKKLTE